MDVFTIRDLRARTGDLVRDAEAGRLSLVTKHGRPVFVAVPFDEATLEHGVTLSFAVRLFSEGHLTMVRSARIAGLSLEAFIEKLGLMGVPAVDYDPAEIADELASLG